jgi:hypothetical protein
VCLFPDFEDTKIIYLIYAQKSVFCPTVAYRNVKPEHFICPSPNSVHFRERIRREYKLLGTALIYKLVF